MLVTFLVSRGEDDSASFSQLSLARKQASGKFLSEPNEISGSQTGSQRSQMPDDARRRNQAISAASWRFTRQKATAPDASVAPYKRRVTGSNPGAPTIFECLSHATLDAWVKNCAAIGCRESRPRVGASPATRHHS